jgi:hypothetical protein
MCNQIVKDKIASVVNNMIVNEKAESFDAMSVLQRMDENPCSYHKEINIELMTMYHEGKMPKYIICVPRPVPVNGSMHRVYINTKIKQVSLNDMSAADRDSNIKVAIARMFGDDVNPTEASRRVMEALLFGGFNCA